MKNIFIHCPFLPTEDYLLMLERLCPNSVRNITVHMDFPARTTPKHIESVVQAQKDFSKGRKVRFQNRAVFARLPRFTKQLCRALRKNGFSVELQVEKNQATKLARIAKKAEKSGINYRICLDETQDQMAAYRLFAARGLHICFTDPQYTAQTADWFDQWLYDPAAQGINTFCDIINMLVMQTRSPNCRHASCFGNVFRVDEQLDVYLCPLHPDERTILGSLRTTESLDALLSCPTVAALLPEVIEKRRRCGAECAAFLHCQGGCPLEEQPYCAYYGETVERVRQRLLEVYHEGKLHQVNYIVKNAILNALAFGTAFFNRQS